MRGRSQQDKMRRGVDNGSVAIKVLAEDHPVSEDHLAHWRLSKAIKRLCISVSDHSRLFGRSQVVGISRIVGRRIFSIVKCLRLEDGLCRGYGKLLQVRPSPHLLHMLRKLAEVWGRGRN